MNFLDDLIYSKEKISIYWKDKSDWNWYFLVGRDWSASLGECWILLEGRDSPDGAKFNGTRFWIRLSDVELIEIGDCHPSWGIDLLEPIEETE